MIKKIIKLIVIALSLGINIVLADETYQITKNRFNNIYAVYDGYDRVHLFYGQSYTLNNDLAYCIEPGISINTDVYYATTNIEQTAIVEPAIKKLKMIAYYGYNYPGHNNNYYYMAAQELMWELLTNREVYWVSEESVDGARINIDSQKNAITSLVNSHETPPSFNDKEITLVAGNTYYLKDDNKVLSRFKITDSTVTNVSINNIDNTLSITPSSPSESGEINFKSKIYTDKVMLLYHNGFNQKLVSATSTIEPTIAKLKIRVIDKPRIKLIKVAADSGKAIYLSGIKFKIKNINTNKYICENTSCIYETDEHGTFITNDKLDYGNYQIEELDIPIDGYLWNSEPLNFTLSQDEEYDSNEDGNYLEIKFENQKVTGTIELTKIGERPVFYDNHLEYQEYNLDNVAFSLYANENIYDSDHTIIYHKDEFINTYRTVDGKITIDNLPLGEYYFKEVSTIDNHILDKSKHYFSLTYKDEYTSNVQAAITIKNYLPKGILIFNKTASETGRPLANTEIAVFNDKDELLLTDYTNEDGQVILEGLPLGKYYLKEITAPAGYIIDEDIHPFEIKYNEQVVYTTMENVLIDAPSTHLDKNYYSYGIAGLLMLLGLCLLFHEKR